MKIDNTALTTHQTCPKKYYYRMVQHWDKRERSAALTAGGAMHEGLAEWYRTGDVGQACLAIEASWPNSHPPDDWRTLAKCVTVMIEYSKEYPDEPWKIVGLDEDTPMIECSFTLPTGRYLSCIECGPDVGFWEGGDHRNCRSCGLPLEELEYGGIFDGLIEQGPMLYVLEHKTTSVMGKRYFLQFKPDNQTTGYVWGGQELAGGKRVGGAYINAIGWYKASSTKFERELTTRTTDDLSEWLDDVVASVEDIRSHARREFWPKNTNACTMWGKCEFHDVCSLRDEKSRQKLLEMSYIKREWDYENRD